MPVDSPEDVWADARCRPLWRSLKTMEPWLQRQQIALTEIPAPSGFEGLRAEWMLRYWQALGVDARLDEVGNVIAELPGVDASRSPIALTAHLDTAFAPGTRVRVRREHDRLLAPGIADNGAGLAALLAIGRVLAFSRLPLAAPLWLIANVGEEGEGDLKGFRHLFRRRHSRSPEQPPFAATVVLDGPGCGQITNAALPSLRLRLSFTGPGGHSWSQLGRASAVHAAVRTATALLSQVHPRSGYLGCNIACIEGGSTVNSIAAEARLKLDLRARDESVLEDLRAAVQRALASGLEAENAAALGGRVRGRVETLGHRPAGRLREDSPLLRLIRQVDATLGIVSHLQAASTDANIPLSLGCDALRLGAGGTGGGVHTTAEWFAPAGRALALQRVLLLLVCAAGLAPPAHARP